MQGWEASALGRSDQAECSRPHGQRARTRPAKRWAGRTGRMGGRKRPVRSGCEPATSVPVAGATRKAAMR